MSESCDSKCEFSSLVVSDLILLICSFILSHPLYFLYLLFFSPYLLKLVSFLSPLFVTTFLVFLAFLVHAESSHTRFAPILERLRFEKDCPCPCPIDEDDDDDDLEIFEIVFGSSPSSMAALVRDQNPSEFLDEKPEKDHLLPEQNLFLGADPSVENKNPCVVMEEKRLENFLKILDEFERLANSNVEEKKKKKLEPSRSAKSEKVVEKQNSLLRNGSEAEEAACNNNNMNIDDDSDNYSKSSQSQSQRMRSDEGRSWRELESGGGGSMRREREWKRTLACKLFEERHNAEGMDSLWEAHEMESSKTKTKTKVVKSQREKGKKQVVEDEEEEEEVGGAQLCCLQALKLSAGKMNLGVGRPNLVKISKAIKGIGWLHKLSKNSKKVHNNGDHRF